jgi:hypothetical protein
MGEGGQGGEGLVATTSIGVDRTPLFAGCLSHHANDRLPKILQRAPERGGEEEAHEDGTEAFADHVRTPCRAQRWSRNWPALKAHADVSQVCRIGKLRRRNLPTSKSCAHSSDDRRRNKLFSHHAVKPAAALRRAFFFKKTYLTGNRYVDDFSRMRRKTLDRSRRGAVQCLPWKTTTQ